MSNGAPAVVVLHGLWMPGFDTRLICRRVAAAGFATHAFRYRSVRRGLEENAARLHEFASRLPNETVHFVGHSLGGVLILCMLARYDFTRAGRVVCLGSPLAGSGTAAVLRRWPGGRAVLGKSICELLDCGGLPPWSGRCEVGVIAGDLPLGAGRFVHVFDGPNDGTVAVAETRLAGARDHVVLPVSHFALLWSGAAHRQIIAFLRDGRFTRAAEPERA
jgi:pimeloyl-ACP methyl ester carboxylesterase